MAGEYAVYQKQYEYFNRLLSQIRGTSISGSQFSGTQVSAPQSFAEVFDSTAAKTGAAPESMDAIFEEAAQTYQVPVALLKAVGKVESNFNAKAVSSAGAQGVMQLMPGTAKELGVTDPFDARSNIMGGAKYLAQKLAKYNGNLDLTLAAYNAGSGTVAKYGGVPSFTRGYIEKVKGYMAENLTTGKTVNTQSYTATAPQSYGLTATVPQSYGQSASAVQSYRQVASVSGTQNGGAPAISRTEELTNVQQQVKDSSAEDAQYDTQLLRLRMQSQVINSFGSLLSGREEKEGSLLEL